MRSRRPGPAVVALVGRRLMTVALDESGTVGGICAYRAAVQGTSYVTATAAFGTRGELCRVPG